MNIVERAENLAADLLKDVEGLAPVYTMLAQRALTAQLLAASKKALGINTTLEDQAIAVAYQNLAVAAGITVAQTVNNLLRDAATTVVSEVFKAAAL